MLDLVKIVTGLGLLYYGGDFLVTGSVRLARFLKISSFVIGATVIAFGTSAPELAVAILAALDAAPELAMGNVIGSNIANIGLVLGLTALIAPIAIAPKRFKREYPPLLIATLIILFLAWDLKIHRPEGIIMVVLLGLYVLRSFSHKVSSVGWGFYSKKHGNQRMVYWNNHCRNRNQPSRNCLFDHGGQAWSW